MPEKASVPGFDKCNKCCSASDGPVHGPSLATHAEICCLYSLSAHSGQYDYDCSKGCPGLTEQKQRGGPAHEPPEARSGSPQDGTLDLAAGCETELAGTGSHTRKRKRIEPRLRPGFKKFTLELRPTKFKKKLWFGTYTATELSRAQDAVNYYMGCNEKYKHPDSPLLFESKPLKGIKFEDLQPSCDDYIILSDGTQELKYKYFARQVKDVIHSITGKQKKSARALSQRNKCKGSQSPRPSTEPGLCDPVMPSGARSATSSGTQEHQPAWDRSPEVDSELSTMYPSFLPLPTDILTPEEDMQFSELLRSGTQRDDIMGYTLEELFAYPPFAYGEGISMDEEDFPSEILWTFQNEGLP